MNPRAIILACISSFVLACGGGDNESGLPTSAPAGPTLPPIATRPAVTATPVAGHPAGTRTNIPVVDVAIAAVESDEETRVLAALSFHPLPCDARGGSRAAPCPSGIQNGTNVDTVALVRCDPTYLAKGTSDLGSAVRQYLRGGGDATTLQPMLYAVTEVSPSRVTSSLPFRYLVIFVSGHSLLVDDTGITHLASPCRDTSPAQLFHPADGVVLAPR